MVTHAPGPYKGPQRSNPELIDGANWQPPEVPGFRTQIERQQEDDTNA